MYIELTVSYVAKALHMVEGSCGNVLTHGLAAASTWFRLCAAISKLVLVMGNERFSAAPVRMHFQ